MEKTPQATPAADNGAVDVDQIVATARKDIPANLQPVFDKIVLSGMRIMFDKSSHKLMLDELEQPGPLAQRLSNGTIKLMYMLWQQSNKTIPPQLMVPATLVLTLRAFQFLQESQDPEATKEVLGQAVELAVNGVIERFKPAGGEQAPAPGAQDAPPQGGMLDAAIGGANG
jgi:hypothetical protein